jgi:hypothetical protein
LKATVSEARELGRLDAKKKGGPAPMVVAEARR